MPLRWPETRSPSELVPVGSYRGTDAMLTSPAEGIGQDQQPAHGGSGPMALEAQCGEGRGSERHTAATGVASEDAGSCLKPFLSLGA